MRPPECSWDHVDIDGARDPEPPTSPVPPCGDCFGTGVTFALGLDPVFGYGCIRCGVGFDLDPEAVDG